MNLLQADSEESTAIRYFQSLMTSFLPRRIKRRFYLATLYARILKSKKPEEFQLERLNHQFKLSDGLSPLLLPCSLHEHIWEGVGLDKIPVEKGMVDLNRDTISQLNDEDCWRITKYITEKCPNWMRYGSPSLMMTDLHDLLTKVFSFRELTEVA